MFKVANYFHAFNKYKFLLYNLVAKDFKLKYRRSVLGVLWSVLNPLLTMMVMTAVFEMLFRAQIEYFPIYFLTGNTLFTFMMESTSSSLQSITGGASLIKKVYVPKYIFILEKCLFSLINLAFSLVAMAIVMIILNFRVSPTFYLFLIPIFYTFVFSAGLGLILASSNVFFRDTAHLYGVVTTAWMFLTPIMYPKEILTERMQRVIEFNPMYHFVEYFRDVLMYGNIPDLRTNLICAGISFGAFFAGVIIFKRSQDKFILYI